MAASQEPLEELGLQAVIELLRGMTYERPWGGEYPNPPRVERDLPLSVDGIGQLPLLIVTIAAGGSGYALGETEEGMVTAGSAIGYRNDFAFDVYGFVQATDVPGDTWCLRLRKDVLDTLCARVDALPDVPQARSLWPVGETEFDAGPLGSSLRMFRQGYRLTFDEVMTLAA